jgi:hypothetical protein
MGGSLFLLFLDFFLVFFFVHDVRVGAGHELDALLDDLEPPAIFALALGRARRHDRRLHRVDALLVRRVVLQEADATAAPGLGLERAEQPYVFRYATALISVSICPPRASKLLPLTIAIANAAICARMPVFCWRFAFLARWRAVTWPISCAITPASSLTSFETLMMPVLM